MRKRTFGARSFSSFIVAALILTAPGILPYQAAAQILSVKVKTPVGQGGASNPTFRSGGSSFKSGPLRLTTGLKSTLVPFFAPGLARSSPHAQVSLPAAALPSRQVSDSLTPIVSPSAGPKNAPATVSGLTPRSVRTPGPVSLLIKGTEAAAKTSRSPGFSDRQGRIQEIFSSVKRRFFSRTDNGGQAPSSGAFGDLRRGRSISDYELESGGRPEPDTLTIAGDDSEGLSPEAEDQTDRDAVVPAPSTKGKGLFGTNFGKGFFSLGKAAVMLIVAMVVAQVGIEALGAAMPALIEQTFGDFTFMAELTIFSMVGSIFGRATGAMMANKYGLTKTFNVAFGLNLINMSILLGLLAFNIPVVLPAMLVFFAIRGFLGGNSATALQSIGPALVGQDPAKLERFWAWKQTLLEIVAVPAPLITGAVVVSMGFLPALIAFPVAMAASLFLMWKFVKVPKAVEELRKAEFLKSKNQPKTGGIFARILHGKKIVWGDPLLRTVFIAFTVFMMLNPFLYAMIAPAYGMFAAGGVALAAAPVYTMLTSLYSLGGLAAGLLMIRHQKKLKALTEPDPATGVAQMTKLERREILRKSLLKSMKWAAILMFALATMAIPLPLLSGLVALPSWLAWAGALSLPALALIPFGVASVMTTVKLTSYFQSKVPHRNDMADAMGFFGAASLTVVTVGLLALKFMFKGKLLFGFQPLAAFAGLTGLAPFLAIAGALVPLAFFYFYITRRLNKLSAPAPQEPKN